MKKTFVILMLFAAFVTLTGTAAFAEPYPYNSPEAVVGRFMTHWAAQDYQHAWDLMTTDNVYNKDFKTFKNVLAIMHTRPERAKMLRKYEIIKVEGTADPLMKTIYIQLKNEKTLEKSFFKVKKEKGLWRIYSFGPG